MTTAALLMRPMAAKKPGGDRKPHASEIRRDNQTVAEFREAARQLTEQAAALEELATMVEEQGFKRLYVDGVRKFPNAMTLLKAYVGNVKKAFIDEQLR